MSDITANIVVGMPSQLFTLARSFKANANGQIYIGQIDTDPTIPANQITVYLENEDGSHVPVSQPISINAAGFPVYSGQIAKFVTVQGYSMAVYDAYGTQQFYFPNILKYDPDQLAQRLSSASAGMGDALIAVKSPLAGAVARTQHSKNQDTVTPEDFGAIGDGTIHPLSERFSTLAAAQAVYPFVTALTQTIDYAAYQAALNSGKALKIISQLMVSNRVTSNLKNVVIETAGVGQASVKFTTTDGGHDFTFKPQDTTPPQILSINGLQIYTDVAVTTPAIRASWGSRQPNASGQCWINNVQIHSGNSTSGSFDAGIDLIYCFGGFLNNIKILGDLNRTGVDAYRFQGCVEMHVTNSHANRYKCPARVKKYVSGDPQSEGIFFNACFLYDCNMGFMSVDQAIHINLIGTFINPNGTSSAPISNIASVTLTNCSQYTIMGCLLYIGGLSTDGANQDGMRITGGAGGVVANNQVIALIKANSRNGLIISADASYGKYTNNKFAGFNAEAIWINSSSATGNDLSDNYLYDCTGQITDAGTGTIKTGNIQCTALGSPKPNNPLLINTTGQAGIGKISGDTNWGALIWPNAGSLADAALCDSGGVVQLSTATGRAGLKVYSKTALPSPALWAGGTMAGVIFVSDDIGGFTLAFSDGTNWRRSADRNIIS